MCSSLLSSCKSYIILRVSDFYYRIFVLNKLHRLLFFIFTGKIIFEFSELQNKALKNIISFEIGFFSVRYVWFIYVNGINRQISDKSNDDSKWRNLSSKMIEKIFF